MGYFEYGGKNNNVKYVISKIDGKKYCKTNGSFTKHLNSYNITELEYFIKYVGESEYCPYCDNLRGFNINDWSFKEVCGRKCLPKLQSEKYNALSEIEKTEWKARSSESVIKFFATDEGKEIIN